jgi:hypothetical protein
MSKSSFAKIEVAQAAARDSIKNLNEILAMSTLAVSGDALTSTTTSSVEDFKLLGRLGKYIESNPINAV